MSDDYKKSNRLSPHDDEEDFDWKKAELEEDLGICVIYPKPSHSSETREKIKKLGFKWVNDRWELEQTKFNLLDLDESYLEDLILQDIAIDWL